MFDFFDPKKNPFISMMFPQGPDGAQEGQNAWMPPMPGMPPMPEMPPMPGMAQGMEMMQLMTQMFQMQMQLAQMMWMMPMQFMQFIQGMAGMAQTGAAAQKEGVAQPGGFQLGGMTIPPELLKKLLQMDMSPENLEKLQKVLDFLFAAIPEKKDGRSDAGED
jgi:hypothetical protein